MKNNSRTDPSSPQARRNRGITFERTNTNPSKKRQDLSITAQRLSLGGVNYKDCGPWVNECFCQVFRFALKSIGAIFSLSPAPKRKAVPMTSKSVVLLLSLIAILGFSPSRAVFAEDDTLVMESFQTVSGSVTEVDTDHKRITFRWMADDLRLQYQDVVLDVPDTCVITKNSETIELTDLESGDSGTVRFDENAQPLPKASSITITE